jgi:hypothetical protein
VLQAMIGGARRGSVWLVALALAVAIIVTLIVNRPIRFPLDDAYITIANAQQLLTGAADSYGQTRPSGATSLVHLLLLAGAGLLLDLPAALMVLSILAAILYAAGLYLAVLRIGERPWLAAACTLAGLFAAQGWYQLMNGLETGWAMAAIAWTTYLSQFPDDPRRRTWLALLLALLPFIRPELGLLSAMLGLSTALHLYREPVQLARFAGTGLVVAGGLVLLALVSVGAILPQTAGAKVAFFADAALPLHQRMFITLVILATPPLAFALLGLFALPRLRQGWALVGFVLLFLAASTMTLPSGLSHNWQRYLYPLVPLAMAGWAAIGANPRLLGGRASLGVTAAALLMASGIATSSWQAYREGLAFSADQERLVRWASRGGLPADARILIHDAGYVGWKTRFRLVDVVGLKTPSSIAAHRRFTLPSAGADRGSAVAEIARQSRPTHAIILDQPFWGDIAGHLRKAGWQLQPLRPEGDTLYQVYRLTPPDNRTARD